MHDKQYLTPDELSKRYEGKITTRTLANWRSQRQGPRYVKIGGRVLYLVSEVINWERGRSPKWSLAVAIFGFGSIAAEHLA